MINPRATSYFICVIYCLSSFLVGMAQPTLDRDLKKPAKYENRVLKAEKTGDKKFTLLRRFTQNTYTHYNYSFNAQVKLNQVLASAKAQHTDRYSELLPFYNFTLEATAGQKAELDSVIYKVNAGILLHDLRSNWMDNLYLQMGQAYYLRNTLDSAYMTFQYMNYAFAPKDDQGYDLYIASNSNEGGNSMKVSTVEDRNIIDRTFSEPPSRNDALIWLIRTHITRAELPTAATLIQTLRGDPDFPERLQPVLAEVTAYYFYNRPQYDSAAFYLEKALPAATSRVEQARWEYLLGQLYGLAGKRAASKEAFLRCMRHTIDPIMEVAAQLQATQQFDSDNELDWQAAMGSLEKMARKERYSNYRDLIYYTLAQIEVTRKKIPEAQTHLLKSVKYSNSNPEQKSKSYLLLGEIAFDQKRYLPAKQYYDSVEANLLTEALAKNVAFRKEVLTVLGTQLLVIQRQDSLQKLAALPEAQRNALLKKQLRALRKQNGLAEEESASTGSQPFFPNSNQGPADLFGASNSGDWYFYNNGLKAKGFTEFRSKWGNRANADNWRRSSAAGAATRDAVPVPGNVQPDAAASGQISLDLLLAAIPLTPEKMIASNDSIRVARFLLGLALQNKLEDYASAAAEYELLLEKFPNSTNEAEILYNLSICYRHLGKTDALATVSNRLTKNFPASRQAKLAANPQAVLEADSAQSRQATARYNDIYNDFIAGRFAEALASKAQADSIYGNHHWTPQLLYIESIYQVKSKNDSLAILSLNNLRSQFPDHALAAKAAGMIDVLKRRKEIELYLMNLQVDRPAEDSLVISSDEPKKPAAPVVQVVPEVAVREPEAKASTTLPSLAKNKVATDSSRLKKDAPKAPASSLFSRHAQQPHFVAIVLEDVDPVYVSESRNAFDRYNKEKYYNIPMNVLVVDLGEKLKLVSIRGLENEQAALDYIKKAKELAPKEIIPWLKADKYSFIPVAEDNMDLLMTNRDFPAYRNFLKQVFPDL